MANDYISREAAISCVKHAWAKGLEPTQYLEELSSADVAERKRGKWKKYGLSGFSYCSECKDCYISTDWLGSGKWSFCPNCGADMREADNG